jgi:cell wall-active antibiotic response 4TMS protein YvqF
MKGRTALGLVLLGAGILWLLSAADVVHLSYTTWIGVLLIGLGLAIAVTRGRHGLLVLAGIVVVLAGFPTLFVEDKVFEGGIGEAIETPQSQTEIEPFRHGIGKLTVDLTKPGVSLDGLTVEASVGIGELVVLVPLDTDVSLDAHVGVGNAQALGQTESGLDVDLTAISGTSGTQELELQLEVGMGNLRVERG